MSARLPVLLYHRVGPVRIGGHPSLTVSLEKFESQLRALDRQGFKGISARSWLAALTEGAPLPPRPILLTFDDGYSDLADNALPALQHLGWTATVFVAVDTIGGESEWDAPEGAAQRLLSAEDIRTWAAQGFEFGAHGATHCDLTRVGPERLRQEVVGGRDALAELVGRPVTAFAYPYGSYNDDVRKMVAGSFELAFGVDEGLNGAATDRTLLRRTMVQPGDTTLDLVLRARLGWSPLERMRAHIRVRDRARHLSRATRRAARRRPSPSSPPSHRRWRIR
jgi:peptidoglycan/xylan/chitin deacetylase (PgdA/CDA1 family)